MCNQSIHEAHHRTRRRAPSATRHAGVAMRGASTSSIMDTSTCMQAPAGTTSDRADCPPCLRVNRGAVIRAGHNGRTVTMDKEQMIIISRRSTWCRTNCNRNATMYSQYCPQYLYSITPKLRAWHSRCRINESHNRCAHGTHDAASSSTPPITTNAHRGATATPAAVRPTPGRPVAERLRHATPHQARISTTHNSAHGVCTRYPHARPTRI